MKEATEIAKLRLFLKLASCAELDYRKDNYVLEALPDIDFNIRSGNSLVGFANYNEVKFAVECNNLNGQMNLLSGNAMDIIDDKAQMVSTAYNRFRNAQVVESSHEELISAKKELQIRLTALNDELNHYMAKKYFVDTKDEDAYKKWLSTHKPFNWFVEFYDVIHNRGGFDVIIGNPPYVVYTKKDKVTKKSIADIYKIKDYQTECSNNLYAFVLERATKLYNTNSKMGMIIPVSSFSSNAFASLKFLLNSNCWLSTYSNRPAKLFQGVEQRLTIIITHNSLQSNIKTSSYKHWYENERQNIFNTLSYGNSFVHRNNIAYKIGNNIENSIIQKIRTNIKFEPTQILNSVQDNACWFHDSPTYWIRSFAFCPNSTTVSDKSNHYHQIYTWTKTDANILAAVLASSVFYLFFKNISNCRDFSIKEIIDFPLNNVSENNLKQLSDMGEKMQDVLKDTALKTKRHYPSGDVEYYEYYPYKAKQTIDEIDKVLAKHYGFTDEELDYIINYDIKYRMGDSLNGDDNE